MGIILRFIKKLLIKIRLLFVKVVEIPSPIAKKINGNNFIFFGFRIDFSDKGLRYNIYDANSLTIKLNKYFYQACNFSMNRDSIGVKFKCSKKEELLNSLSQYGELTNYLENTTLYIMTNTSSLISINNPKISSIEGLVKFYIPEEKAGEYTSIISRVSASGQETLFILIQPNK